MVASRYYGKGVLHLAMEATMQEAVKKELAVGASVFPLSSWESWGPSSAPSPLTSVTKPSCPFCKVWGGSSPQSPPSHWGAGTPVSATSNVFATRSPSSWQQGQRWKSPLLGGPQQDLLHSREVRVSGAGHWGIFTKIATLISNREQHRSLPRLGWSCMGGNLLPRAK